MKWIFIIAYLLILTLLCLFAYIILIPFELWTLRREILEIIKNYREPWSAAK